MSKEGNMEELQRWSMEIVVKPGKYSYGNESVGYEHDPDGEWVRFSDVEELVARFQARIEELEGIVSGKTQFDRAAAVRAAWRERIEGLVERELGRYRREIQTAELWPGNDPNFDWEHVRVPHLRSAGDAMSRVYVLREALTVLSQGEGQNGE
jgi:hypothetical protein